MSFEHIKKCNAKSKRSGKQCRNPAVSDSTKCRHHGGRSTGPKDPTKLEGNLNAAKHGAYVDKLITEEEHELYNQFFEKLHNDFVINESSDQLGCELAGIYFIRLLRALKNEDFELIGRIDSLLRTHLRDLKATREKREGDTVTLKTTPAEWAANLLAKYREEKAKTDKTEKNSHICENESSVND